MHSPAGYRVASKRLHLVSYMFCPRLSKLQRVFCHLSHRKRHPCLGLYHAVVCHRPGRSFVAQQLGVVVPPEALWPRAPTGVS